ncbi:MAG: hypothetical protein ACLTI1_00055 [Clostridia bacterium]
MTQEVPAFLVPGVALKSRIRIEKISHMPGVYSFSCQMEQKDWFGICKFMRQRKSGIWRCICD